MSKRRASAYIASGCLLAVLSGLYVGYMIYVVHKVNTIRKQMEFNEERFASVFDERAQKRDLLKTKGEVARRLLVEIPSVPALRDALSNAKDREGSLETQIDDLNKQREQLELVISALRKARSSALDGVALPVWKILQDSPTLKQVHDWDRARPLIEKLNEIVVEQQQLQQQLGSINQQLQSSSNNEQALRQQQQDLRNQLDAARHSMMTLQTEYDRLTTELQQNRDSVSEKVDALKGELDKVKLEIAKTQHQIDLIERELTDITDRSASIDKLQGAISAVQNHLQTLTTQMQTLDDTLATDAKNFRDQSQGVRTNLGIMRDLILMRFKRHAVLLATGIVGCGLFHWGLFGLRGGKSYRRLNSNNQDPISFWDILTVMIPRERYQRISMVGSLPKLANWYLAFLMGSYILVFTTALFIS